MQLTKLLSTLADSCARGCEVIRSVERRRSDPTTSDISVHYKVAGDARSALTEADISSQLVIITCIRSVWGDTINIIGEEDNDDESKDLNVEETFLKYDVDLPSIRPVQTTLFGDDVEVDMNDITIYIDPMDGTREFVEGRFQNVQCLIGVCHKNLPACGVIGLPFVKLYDDDIPSVMCALNLNNFNIFETVSFTSAGIGRSNASTGFQSLEQIGSSEEKTLKIFAGDSNRWTKTKSLKYLSDFIEDSNQGYIMNLCVAGGCGNKILRVTACGSLGCEAMSIMPPGNCSWDTAAPTAVLLAACDKFGFQSKVSDMLGNDLEYDSTGNEVTNTRGCLFSCGRIAVKYHEKLCEAMKNDPEVLKNLL